MFCKGIVTLSVINTQTGLQEKVVQGENLLVWNTLSLIFDGNQVFKDCWVGVSDSEAEPDVNVNTIVGKIALATPFIRGFLSSDHPNTSSFVEAPYGSITAVLEPNIFRTRKISCVFLTRKEGPLATDLESDTSYSIGVLTHCKLAEPVFQEFNQRIVIDYRIQFIDFGSSELVRLHRTFPNKLGRYLFGIHESSVYGSHNGLFTVSSSFSHCTNNNDYLNLLFDYLPQNLVSTTGADFYLRYFVDLLGVPLSNDSSVGRIIGSLGYGSERYTIPGGLRGQVVVPFTSAPFCSELSSCDHQGTFYHFPDDVKPFLEKEYVEEPVGLDKRTDYALQVVFSGNWEYKHWPELYRITFTQSGLLPDVTTDNPVAAYVFSYRHHLGFEGNSYVSDLCVDPFLSPLAYPNIHLTNKQKYSDTEVLCWDAKGISIIDLITGNHVDFDFDEIKQVEINSKGVVYVACAKGLLEVYPKENAINRLVDIPVIGVCVGVNDTVYAVDQYGLRVSYLNYQYFRRFDPNNLQDEEDFYSRDIEYRFCKKLLIRENEIKFIKASPIKNQIGLVVRLPLRHYKIIWWDLDKDKRSLGPDANFVQSGYLKEDIRTDWFVCSKPGYIGKYFYPSVWLLVDSTGTYNIEFNFIHKRRIASAEESLCHVSLYDSEPFIFTSKDLRDPTGFVLVEYQKGSKLGNIFDLLGTVTHLYKGICLVSFLSSFHIPSYLTVLGTDDTPWGSERGLDLYQGFAYCKLWNHFVWDREEQRWLPDYSFEAPRPGIDDKLVHYTVEDLVNGVKVAFRLVYDFKPIEVVRMPDLPLTVICFDELIIDNFVVANADSIRWTQTAGRSVAVLSENTTRPRIRRRSSLIDDQGRPVVLTAEICNPSGCIYVDIPIHLVPTSIQNGFTQQALQADRECKRVPCRLRPAQEVYVEPPNSLEGHRIAGVTAPLTAIYWDLPTCETEYLQSTTVQVNVEGRYRDLRTYPVNERRIFLASTPNWYRIKSTFNVYETISEAFSCVFYLTPNTFGMRKQSITDDSYTAGFSVNGIESTHRSHITYAKLRTSDEYNGFSVHALQSITRLLLTAISLRAEDVLSTNEYGGLTVLGVNTANRLSLDGIIIG